jgi:DNA polymerase-1
MKRRLVLIDGNSLVNRAFFALPPFRTASGEPTSAVYGFVTMLLRLLEEENPDCVAVAFDRRTPTFRHEQYHSYKAHRTGMPDSLGVQIPVLKEVLAGFGIPIFEIDGYEADDVLATMASRAEGEGYESLIVTGDRDALQLVSPGIKCMLTKKGISETRLVGEAELVEEYGLAPHQFVDVKGLMGDASDNIPGVPGIGEKTAVKLVREFGSLENLLANLDKVKTERLRGSLEKWGDQALMSRELSRLVKDVPLEFRLHDCERRPPDRECLAALFERLEFRSLMEKLDLTPAASVELAIPPVKVFKPGDAALAWDGPVQVVAEFSGSHGLLGMGVFPSVGTGVYVPGDLGETEILRAVSPLFSDSRVLKDGYRLKPLLVYLKARGVRPQGFRFDAELAAYLLDPSRSSYRVEDLAREHLGCGITPPGEIKESERARKGFEEAPPQEAASYMAQVALALQRMRPIILEALEGGGMASLFADLEMPLTEVLADMEIAGVEVDPGQLEEMAKEMESRIHQLEAEIHGMTGVKFNINSTRQLGEVLFERLRLPVVKKTKTGYSTDAEVLWQLASHSDVAARVLEYRQMVKLKSTYLDGLRAFIDPRSGRIHTTFHQTITATGRLSSAEPNLQNIPIRLDLGRRVRQVFRAREGCLLLSGDYSQIELRILAHLSGDPVLMEAFHRGEDIHTRTAAEVFGVDPKKVNPEMRDRAKAVNFGIVYGISDFGLSRDIGVSKAEAGQYIQGYFRRYNGVRYFISNIIAEARARGHISTILGRRRFVPDINSKNPAQRGFAERTAINTPIQGSAADIIKLAMLRIHSRLREGKHEARMILQVHDELIFEVPVEEMEEIQALAREEMENAYPLDVPLKVDIKKGPNWYDMK